MSKRCEVMKSCAVNEPSLLHERSRFNSYNLPFSSSSSQIMPRHTYPILLIRNCHHHQLHPNLSHNSHYTPKLILPSQAYCAAKNPPWMAKLYLPASWRLSWHPWPRQLPRDCPCARPPLAVRGACVVIKVAIVLWIHTVAVKQCALQINQNTLISPMLRHSFRSSLHQIIRRNSDRLPGHDIPHALSQNPPCCFAILHFSQRD